MLWSVKPSPLATALKHAWCSSHPVHGIAEFAAQRRDVEATPVAPLDPVARWPETRARVQCRGVGRQALHVQPWRRPIRQERLAAVAAVAGGAIPEDDHLAGHLAPQVLETGDDIVSIAGAVLAVA